MGDFLEVPTKDFAAEREDNDKRKRLRNRREFFLEDLYYNMVAWVQAKEEGAHASRLSALVHKAEDNTRELMRIDAELEAL